MADNIKLKVEQLEDKLVKMIDNFNELHRQAKYLKKDIAAKNEELRFLYKKLYK